MRKIRFFATVLFLLVSFYGMSEEQLPTLSGIDLEMMGRNITMDVLQGNSNLQDDETLFSQAYALWNNRHVEVRGFLYQMDNGMWVVAREPNLKTCCFGSPHHLLEQIVVEGEGLHPSESQVVTIRGHFLVKPERDENSHLEKLLYLTDAKIKKNENQDAKFQSVWLIGLAIFFIALSLSIFFRRKK